MKYSVLLRLRGSGLATGETVETVECCHCPATTQLNRLCENFFLIFFERKAPAWDQITKL